MNIEKLIAESWIAAAWKENCQDKWDYDASIVGLSSRYYGPRDYRPIGGALTKPSATASLHLWAEPNDVTLIEKEFEGETEAEVKALVELWAKEQFDTIASIITNHYGAGK